MKRLTWNSVRMLRQLAVAAVAALFVAGGCRPVLREPLPICPGKESLGGALSALRIRSEKLEPLRATGTCRLEYYTQENRKAHKEVFPVRLWVNPPAQMSLRGDVAFDPRGLVVGSNQDEFWLSLRPKKISCYWWGRWSRNTYVEKLILSPRIVLEALGIAVGDGEGWSLSNKGPFDILTQYGDAGVMIKRIYIHSCNYLVRKIEYFNEFGQVEVVAELDEYEEAEDGFSIPQSIKITKRGDGGRDDSAGITLKSVKSTSFNEKQLELLFVRPSPGGFENVYEVVGGKWVEQPAVEK